MLSPFNHIDSSTQLLATASSTCINTCHESSSRHDWRPVSSHSRCSASSASPLTRAYSTRYSALQGSFSEHISLLNTLTSSHNLTAIPVRTAAELAQCTGLIIPGGESTTISLLLQRGGLLEPVREFVRRAKAGTGSVWGTCAGMILLGKEVVGSKDGYEGLDGIDYKVVRNQWGRQVSATRTLVLD